MKNLNILLTNDDGLTSHGMVHLENELRSFANVWAVAPDRERSATSQAISIRDTLRLTQMSERHFMVNGFPADCVNVALYSKKFPKFDLVISGINHGVNLGDDVHYSGTVGAARHAAVHGIKAVSVSCPIRDHGGDFRRVASWLRLWISENHENLKTRIVYNINFPEENSVKINDPFPDTEITMHGKRRYVDSYEAIEEGEDYWIFRLEETILGFDKEEGTDFHALKNGKISITPLSLQTSHQDEMNLWKSKKQKMKIENMQSSNVY